MPWRWPAWQEHIRQNALESEPRLGLIYRCHVCRLELTFDVTKHAFDVAPLTGEAVPRQPCPHCQSTNTVRLGFPINYNRCDHCGWVWKTVKTGDADHGSQVRKSPKRKRVS